MNISSTLPAGRSSVLAQSIPAFHHTIGLASTRISQTQASRGSIRVSATNAPAVVRTSTTLVTACTASTPKPSATGTPKRIAPSGPMERSEEHTSELQSQSNLVCRLLLEKKKENKHVQLPSSLGR